MPTRPVNVVLVSCLLVLASCLFEPGMVVAAESSIPVRTWFLHQGFLPVGGVANLTMNELPPQGQGFYPPVRGVVNFTISGSGTSTRFILAPPYEFGFEILAGTAFLDLDMGAYFSSKPCCIAPTPLNAEFNFTLATAKGQSIGSAVTTIVFRDWQSGPTSSEFQAFNHTLVSLPIPTALSLRPEESAYLEMTWLNPDLGHVLTLYFDHTSSPASLQVPANYYSSGLTLQSDKRSARLGDTVHIQGKLIDMWNSSGIPNQKITLFAHHIVYPYPNNQKMPITTVSTSSTGEYSFDWSPSIVGDFWIDASWSGSRYFTSASSPLSDPSWVSVSKALSRLTIHTSPYFGLTTPSVSVRGGLTGLGGPIKGADVVISYNVPGSETWTVISSSRTDAGGNYEIVWAPQATGNYSIRASWTGDNRQDYGEAITSINALTLQFGWSIVTWLAPSGLIAGAAVFVWKRRSRRNPTVDSQELRESGLTK